VKAQRGLRVGVVVWGEVVESVQCADMIGIRLHVNEISAWLVDDVRRERERAMSTV
jgi:hypothetical protein